MRNMQPDQDTIREKRPVDFMRDQWGHHTDGRLPEFAAIIALRQ